MSALSTARLAVLNPVPRVLFRTPRAALELNAADLDTVFRHGNIKRTTPAPAAEVTPKPATLLDFLNAIATYLPTEGIALYAFAMSFASIAKGIPVIALIVGIALNFLVTLFGYRSAAKAANEPVNSGRLARQLTSTVVLTAVYASTLAGNVFAPLSPNKTVYAGIVAAFLALLLPFIAVPLGLVARPT